MFIIRFRSVHLHILIYSPKHGSFSRRIISQPAVLVSGCPPLTPALQQMSPSLLLPTCFRIRRFLTVDPGVPYSREDWDKQSGRCRQKSGRKKVAIKQTDERETERQRAASKTANSFTRHTRMRKEGLHYLQVLCHEGTIMLYIEVLAVRKKKIVLSAVTI